MSDSPIRFRDLTEITQSTDLANDNKVVIVPKPSDPNTTIERTIALSTLASFFDSSRYSNSEIDTLISNLTQGLDRLMYFTAYHDFTVPSDTPGRMLAICIGGGGAGGGVSKYNRSDDGVSPGGSSGSIAISMLTVTPGLALTINVGTGGISRYDGIGTATVYGSGIANSAATVSRIYRLPFRTILIEANGGNNGQNILSRHHITNNNFSYAGADPIATGTGDIIIPGFAGGGVKKDGNYRSGFGGGFGGGPGRFNDGDGIAAIGNFGGGGSGAVFVGGQTNGNRRGGNGAPGSVIIFY